MDLDTESAELNSSALGCKVGNDTALCALGSGTTSVHLRERKNGPLVPKRHKMKHLDFLILLLESRLSKFESGGHEV